MCAVRRRKNFEDIKSHNFIETNAPLCVVKKNTEQQLVFERCCTGNMKYLRFFSTNYCSRFVRQLVGEDQSDRDEDGSLVVKGYVAISFLLQVWIGIVFRFTSVWARDRKRHQELFATTFAANILLTRHLAESGLGVVCNILGWDELVAIWNVIDITMVDVPYISNSSLASKRVHSNGNVHGKAVEVCYCSVSKIENVTTMFRSVDWLRSHRWSEFIFRQVDCRERYNSRR